jgi:hypothetical protein
LEIGSKLLELLLRVLGGLNEEEVLLLEVIE